MSATAQTMEAALKGLLDIVLARAQASAVAATRRAALATLPAIAALFAALAALGCGIGALWIVAIPYVGQAGAALCATAVLLLAAIVLALTARALSRPPAAPPPAAVSVEALTAEALRLFHDNKAAVLVAALVAGLCAGHDPRAGRR